MTLKVDSTSHDIQMIEIQMMGNIVFGVKLWKFQMNAILLFFLFICESCKQIVH